MKLAILHFCKNHLIILAVLQLPHRVKLNVRSYHYNGWLQFFYLYNSSFFCIRILLIHYSCAILHALIHFWLIYFPHHSFHGEEVYFLRLKMEYIWLNSWNWSLFIRFRYIKYYFNGSKNHTYYQSFINLIDSMFKKVF